MSNDECETPQEFFDALNSVYKFKLDAAASKRNHKCKKYFTKKDDALNILWKTTGYVWINPPYSKEAGGILEWLNTAYYNVSTVCCKGVVCLVICDVSTESRQFAWDNASEIVELSPRINFSSPGWSKRTGGFQSYQLVIFDNEAKYKCISRWNWKKEGYLFRSMYKMTKV